MKYLFVCLLTCSFATSAFAESKCVRAAIRAAKESSRETARVLGVEALKVNKSYLESYYIILAPTNDLNNKEAFAVTLLKSDCSIVSLIPEL